VKRTFATALLIAGIATLPCTAATDGSPNNLDRKAAYCLGTLQEAKESLPQLVLDNSDLDMAAEAQDIDNHLMHIMNYLDARGYVSLHPASPSAVAGHRRDLNQLTATIAQGRADRREINTTPITSSAEQCKDRCPQLPDRPERKEVQRKQSQCFNLDSELIASAP
jgi:hypothetical protein